MIKNFLSGRIEIGLESVVFEDIGRPTTDEEINVFYDDSIYTEIQENCLVVRVQRQIYFKPESLFQLSTVYFVKHAYIEGIEKEAYNALKSVSEDELKKEIMEDTSYYTQDKYDKISLLIGQITSTFGDPIITPPLLRHNSDSSKSE